MKKITIIFTFNFQLSFYQTVVATRSTKLSSLPSSRNVPYAAKKTLYTQGDAIKLVYIAISWRGVGCNAKTLQAESLAYHQPMGIALGFYAEWQNNTITRNEEIKPQKAQKFLQT